MTQMQQAGRAGGKSRHKLVHGSDISQDAGLRNSGDCSMAKMLKLTPKRMAEGLAHLAAVDPDLARALKECGAPPMRTSDPGFATLLRSIMGQQVSVHAARSIWEKLNRLVSPMTPENMMLASDATLREAGLSGQKARYAKALAADIVEK